MVSESDTNNFTYTAGDYIKTDVAWNPPDIKTFCEFAVEHLVDAFPKHDIFIHGSFPFLPTWDVDIAIIGEPTDEAGKTIIDLTNTSLNQYNMLVDISIYETTALWEGVDAYNRNGDTSALGRTDMYKPYFEAYKNGEPMHYLERKVEKLSEHLYKHYTSLEEPQPKFKQSKKYIYEARHISTFLKVHNV
jgi:hypothetical protein